MDKFVIEGGIPLKGSVRVSGAKNASLALLPASILASGTVSLHNTPKLNDVFTMIKLLQTMGVNTTFIDETLTLDTRSIQSFIAPYEHVKKMRASVYVLGPLLGRYGKAEVSLPGGCAWGPRPIDLHLIGLKKLGAAIDLEGGYIKASCKNLIGAKISFDKPSVGATGNILMAAVLAKGTTILNNAAMEPEITNLIEMLKRMGARISGENTSILEIEGVDELHGTEVDTIPDRIEAGTLMCAAALTHGTIILENAVFSHCLALISKLEDSGVAISYEGNRLIIDASSIAPKSVDVTTGVFPGFPTDMQAQWIAYMALAQETATVTDTVYHDRFSHVPELIRLGANIAVRENSAVVKGVSHLVGAKVMSTDLRASASLVIAGLAAQGTTEVLRIYHLDRGYQNIEQKLTALGARIQRISGSEY